MSKIREPLTFLDHERNERSSDLGVSLSAATSCDFGQVLPRRPRLDEPEVPESFLVPVRLLPAEPQTKDSPPVVLSVGH